MTYLNLILKEFFGLFIDDKTLVIAIGLWLMFAFVTLQIVHMDLRLRGLVLFIGLAGILFENVSRTTKRR